ncbi:hypothetical protein Zm00014a_018122 [Zea mays]|uniref:Uncharacterized protein n=1 Tax=Zea mays TaxID=4577 RepID=A0A3L6DBV2_MAIZE|nr:hypothetical protein Zm00014a_018122 [Zea mays]
MSTYIGRLYEQLGSTN